MNSKTRKKEKKFYFPPKYFKGLSKKKATQRKKEIKKFGSLHWKNPNAYKGFQTDKKITTKKSSYTKQWDSLFPNAKSLQERANVTGVPLKYIKTVYNRGSAAWRTGHRPGASQQAWSYPRVSSYLLCGKTHYTADADQVRLAKKESANARKWFKRCKTSKQTKI